MMMVVPKHCIRHNNQLTIPARTVTEIQILKIAVPLEKRIELMI